MKRKILFGLLILTLIAVPLFAAACEEEVTPPGEEEEEKGPPAEEEEEEGNWWDKFGEPQYGGALIFCISPLGPTWDTTTFIGAEFQCYFERLFSNVNWTLDRDIWPFQTAYIPVEYNTGWLAESWEWTDPQTLTIHIREGVHWQDKPPVNGREFTAYDVEEHYDRMMGTGHGYTEPIPMYRTWIETWEKVTATDDHTVVFKFKHPSALGFTNLLFPIPLNKIEAPEAVEAEGGALTDWTKAVGTGPWMLTDYVDGTSMIYSKNPNYWGNDPRHPENQIPYADELKLLMIPDLATAMAAIRAGRIDELGSDRAYALPWEQAESLKSTNPELLMVKVAREARTGLGCRLDAEPFTDIRVRKALQMAINREEIAAEYYHGEVDGLPAGLYHPSMEGYCLAYEDWSQELKDEYSYNPTRAKELLEEAAADGVFERNQYGGFDTNVVASVDEDVYLLQIFQAYFMEIGVDMEIRTVDQGTFEAIGSAAQHDQLICVGSSRILTWAYDSYKSGAGRNYTLASDPAYDELASKAEAAGDEAELRKWAPELDRYFLSQHWVITACPPVAYYAWQPYLKGFSGEDLRSTVGQIFALCWIDLDLKESLGR